jgi:hypothetical protein
MPPPDEPVRVRLYGLIPMTRGRYLTQAALLVLLAAVVMAAWLILWMPRLTAARDASPQLASIQTCLSYLPWALLALVTAQGVETIFVLRAFARKEAGRRNPPQP